MMMMKKKTQRSWRRKKSKLRERKEKRTDWHS
jgi:hypothetical protein